MLQEVLTSSRTAWAVGTVYNKQYACLQTYSNRMVLINHDHVMVRSYPTPVSLFLLFVMK